MKVCTKSLFFLLVSIVHLLLSPPSSVEAGHIAAAGLYGITYDAQLVTVDPNNFNIKVVGSSVPLNLCMLDCYPSIDSSLGVSFT